MVALAVMDGIAAGTCQSLLPSDPVAERMVCAFGSIYISRDGCGLHSIVKGARTFEPLLLPLSLYDKSARSPYVERMRPLS